MKKLLLLGLSGALCLSLAACNNQPTEPSPTPTPTPAVTTPVENNLPEETDVIVPEETGVINPVETPALAPDETDGPDVDGNADDNVPSETAPAE